MATNKIDLSHEEMWDDSVLIDSWNQALDEYKVSESSFRFSSPLRGNSNRKLRTVQHTHVLVIQKYHSIHAKGGSLEDLEAKEAQALR